VRIGAPEICASPFKGTDDLTYDYFDDDGLDYDTGTTGTGVIAYWDTVPYVEKLPNGSYLCIWSQFYRDDPSYPTVTVNNSLWGLKAKVRAFIYNPLLSEDNGYFVEFQRAKGDLATLQQVERVSQNITTGLAIQAHYVGFRREDTKLYAYTSFYHDDGHLVKSFFGDINVTGGGDVTPPYIIRQILTHSLFGVYADADIIDEASYAEMVQHCEDEGVMVSATYRTDESAQRWIEVLLATYSGFLVVDASLGKIKFRRHDPNASPVRTIDNSRLLRRSGELPVKTSRGASQDTYNLIRINYFDRNLDYKMNQIEEGDEVDQDLNGIRLRDFPGQLVMDQSLARKMAVRALWDNLYTRDSHQFHLGWKDSDLEPGDLITLVDSFSGLNQLTRITRMKEIERGTFETNAVQQLWYIPGYAPSQISQANWEEINAAGTYSREDYTNVSSPYNRSDPAGIPVPMESQVYELPYEFQIDTTPRAYIGWIANGPAAGATLYTSVDGISYVSAGQASPYPLAGRLLSNLPSKNEVVTNVDVFLQPNSAWNTTSPGYSMTATLNDINEAGMHTGASLLWVGSEMIAYSNVTLVSQNRYRLGKVYRGWGGTIVASHLVGDYFYKHGAGVFEKVFNEDQIGQTFYYKVAPYGFTGAEYSVASIEAKQYTFQGTFYRPQVPATPQFQANRGITKVNVSGPSDIGIQWARSSRASGYGFGGAGNNPGGYGAFIDDIASLGWRVEVVGSGGVTVRSTYVSTPGYSYLSATNAADNGAWRGNIAFRVTPRNAYGDAPATSVLSMELFY
jgi:hypothetical protein